ncbi:MAG: hypothetical protein ABW022_16065, partial [Actinoplanes sp.]
MALDIPEGVSTNGTVAAIFIETMLNFNVPKLTEINAGSSLDLSCYLSELETDATENTIEDPRLCARQVFEAPGDFSNSLGLTYVFNPGEPTENEAMLALPRGTTGFIVIRWAIDAEEPFAIGDIVDVYKVRMGFQKKVNPTRNAMHR